MIQNSDKIYKKISLFAWRRIHLHIPTLDLRGKRVIDVGCWWGWFVRVARDQGADVNGFDCNWGQITDAVAFLQGNDGLCVASAEEIPYKDETFDVAFSYHVMEHVRSDSIMLREMNRVLVKSGILILAVPNDFSFSILPYYPLRWLLNHRAEYLKRHNRYDWLKSIVYSDMSHYREYTKKSLYTLLKANNFKTVLVKSYGFELPYPIKGRVQKNIRMLLNRFLGPITPPFFRSEFIVHAIKDANIRIQ
jgi:2-polyprenyl-3-methyl-5-hydroxy-6-metoxy-1,4-benzoquinol methylase